MLIADPNCTISIMETELPNRATLRKEIVEPKLAQESTEMLLPSFSVARLPGPDWMEIPEPSLMQLRRESDDPSSTKFRTDMALLSLDIDLTEITEPRRTESSTLRFASPVQTSFLANKLKLEPRVVIARTLSAEPT
jgi:hypothetical protein